MPRRAPAFSFYADDWLAGTLAMSLEEKGIYIDALALCWSKRGLSKSEETYLTEKSNLAAPLLKAHFKKHDGRLWHPRLIELLAEQQSRAERGRLGAEKRWQADSKPDSKPEPMTKPVANAKPMPSVSVSDSVSDSEIQIQGQNNLIDSDPLEKRIAFDPETYPLSTLLSATQRIFRVCGEATSYQQKQRAAVFAILSVSELSESWLASTLEGTRAARAQKPWAYLLQTARERAGAMHGAHLDSLAARVKVPRSFYRAMTEQARRREEQF